MLNIINIIVVIVALLHSYFLILEMFLWTKPTGLRVFRNSLEKATATKVLASNQGLYNGFLAAGLIWSVAHSDQVVGLQIKVFFLTCVVIAGIYGAYSVSKRIFYIQAMPALIGLILVGLNY